MKNIIKSFTGKNSTIRSREKPDRSTLSENTTFITTKLYNAFIYHFLDHNRPNSDPLRSPFTIKCCL